MNSVHKEGRKHAQTFYNRHALNVLLQAYLQMKEKHLDSISSNELLGRLNFGINPLKIHLKYLQDRKRMIHVEGDLNEDIFYITLTDIGESFVKVLKDIKYQTLYNANIKRKKQNKNNKGHVKTFYNRYALFLSFVLYKHMRNNETDTISCKDLQEIYPFSEKSLILHMRYLTNGGNEIQQGKFAILNEFSDKQFKFTEYGVKVIHILKDIKYQSLYNVGAEKSLYKKDDMKEKYFS